MEHTTPRGVAIVLCSEVLAACLVFAFTRHAIRPCVRAWIVRAGDQPELCAEGERAWLVCIVLNIRSEDELTYRWCAFPLRRDIQSSMTFERRFLSGHDRR